MTSYKTPILIPNIINMYTNIKRYCLSIMVFYDDEIRCRLWISPST